MWSCCADKSAFFAFVTNSAFVLVKVFGLSPREYGALFAAVMIGQIAGAWFSSRMVMRLGIAGMLRLGTRVACAGGVLALVLALLGADHWMAVVVPFMIYMFSASCIMPNATAAALSPFASNAGTVSSLLGSTQFLLGACVSIALGALYDGTARPMAAALALGGVGALLAERFLVQRRAVA